LYITPPLLFHSDSVPKWDIDPTSYYYNRIFCSIELDLLLDILLKRYHFRCVTIRLNP
jgi:hypothetical protein